MSKGRLIVVALILVAAVVAGVVMRGRAARRSQGEQILARYVQATGGAQAYGAIRSLAIHGTATLQGKPATFDEYRVASGRYLRHVVTEDLEASEQRGTDGKNAWSIGDKHEVLIGSRKLDLFREAAFDRDIRWKDFFESVEYAGAATYAGKQCDKVILTPHEGKPRTRYYDTATGLLVAEESSPHVPGAAPQVLVQTFDDYRSYGGVKLPARLTTQTGGQTVTARIQTVQVNQELPDEMFDPPQTIKILLVGLPQYMK